MAIVWAIMPPIDAPTTCARSIPRASISPIVSPAMSVRRYGPAIDAPLVRAVIASITFGTPSASSLVERPTSRLSKRTTRCPRSASIAHNSSSQKTSETPRPITRSSGRPSRGPISSYAISRPFDFALGMMYLCWRNNGQARSMQAGLLSVMPTRTLTGARPPTYDAAKKRGDARRRRLFHERG